MYVITIIFHVVIGTIALLSGAMALSSEKGSRLHKGSGKAFVGAMFISAAVGAGIALLKPELVTAVSGFLTCYLLLTSWASIALKNKHNLHYIVAAIVVLIIGATSLIGGLEAQQASDGLKDGFPAQPYFSFAGLAIFAGLLDLKCLLTPHLSRPQILTRHIWRMCTAMLIGASALLLGQMHVFPAAIRSEAVLSIPLLIILLVMIYSIGRTRLPLPKNS